MKRLLLFISFILLISLPSQGQNLISSEFKDQLSAFDIFIQTGVLVENGVVRYKLWYTTTGSDALPDTASGLLIIPAFPTGSKIPIVMYQHGTTNGPQDCPSTLGGGSFEATAYGAYGFITAAADYLGLGESRGFHPYVHAATEASAAVDMLKASIEFLEGYQVDWDETNLFVAGYSQGGHGAMALHRDLEQNWNDIYPVTASTPMSGPYSISGVMRDLVLNDDVYGTASYIPYVVMSYQEIYGNLYNTLEEVFKEPYVTEIKKFAANQIPLSALNSTLVSLLVTNEGASIPKRMFQDSTVVNIESNPNHPFNMALRDNDTFDWAPDAPTRLYYCMADEQVPFRNSVVADSIMNLNGAFDLAAENLNSAANHSGCALFALTSSIAFFNSNITQTSVADNGSKQDMRTLYPNPTGDEIFIDVSTEQVTSNGQLQISTIGGQTLSFKDVGVQQPVDVSDLDPGIYVFKLTIDKHTTFHKVTIVR